MPLLCVAGLSLSALAVEEDAWRWTVAPYLWAPSIGTDLAIQSPPSQSSSQQDFGDVIDKIDGVFEIHVEGQGERFGVFADYTYLSLVDGDKHPRFQTRSQLDTVLFELAAFWKPAPARLSGLDVFAGLRYIDSELEFRLTPVNPVFSPVKLAFDKSFSDLSRSLSVRTGI
jgi:hypothetical protein